MAAVVDGRIDNLDELAAALGTAAGSPPSAVVLAAYHRWGAEAGSHILGDYAVVIADESKQRVICIRDPLGQRPLFYGTGTRGVVFGSEPQQVVRHPAIQPDINEAMVAEHLTDAPATMAETLWRNVYRLPPAHLLEISASGTRVQRYWDFDPEARVRHASPAGYAEHFRDLFTHAVECRVRDTEAVGVLLSGGLDSSSIAGVAHAIGKNAARAPIHGFSVAFPGQACDETPYSDAVAETWGLPLTRIDAVLPSRDDVEREADRYLDPPRYPSSFAVDPLRRRAAAMGVHVMLTGCGGDELFSGNPVYPMDLLRNGRVLACGRAMVDPFLTDRARRLLRPIFGARAPRRTWIRSDFARRVGLEDRLRIQPPAPFPTREQQEIHKFVTSLPLVLAGEMEDRVGYVAGIEHRHPFYDRRVAEFALALPTSERWQGRQLKVVVRRALRDHLPPLVAARTDKAEFSPTFVEAFEAIDGRRPFTHLRSEEAGWVNGDVVRMMYKDMIQLYGRGGDAYIGLTSPLWAVAALEMWLERTSWSKNGVHVD